VIFIAYTQRLPTQHRQISLLTYEIVGYRPHPLGRHHDPDNNQVTARRHNDHAAEEDAPEHLTPPRDHKCKRARLHGRRRILGRVLRVEGGGQVGG